MRHMIRDALERFFRSCGEQGYQLDELAEALHVAISPYIVDTQTIMDRLDSISTQIADLQTTEDNIMVNVQDIQTIADSTLAQVTAARSVDDAVKGVVDGNNVMLAKLAADLAAAQASGDPAALQKLADTISAIQSTDLANGAVVADAVKAGTPAAAGP